MNQGPDSTALRTAFEGIETVVALEAFWTETARTATIVLPPALWLEEEDVIGSMWRSEVAASGGWSIPPRVVAPTSTYSKTWRTGSTSPLLYATLDDWLRARLPGGAYELPRANERATRPRRRHVAWRNGFYHPDGRFRLLSAVLWPPRKTARAFLPLSPPPAHPLFFFFFFRSAEPRRDRLSKPGAKADRW